MSPDGKTVAFSYLGDLWTVPADGGVATHLTMHEKHDFNPVFSPDTGLSAEFAGGAVTEEMKKKFMATIPLGRFSTPLDVANACLYLASDEAAMISGTCIEVDGARCV